MNYKDNMCIKKFVPKDIKPSLNFVDTIVLYYPTVETLANNYVANNKNCRKGTIIWNKFPDGQPNITFEHQTQLENKKIIFFMSLYDTTHLFEQLSILKILPRQFITSLDIYICYYSVGTMERVEEEGTLATADTMANIISNCMETCKEGKPTIHIYDIHALQNRFYFDYNKVHVKLETGVNLLKQNIDLNTIIVFPDDGAYKRFGKDFKMYKTLICSKIRENEKRKITISDKINFPLNNQYTYDEIIIVDDLVQSGGTLIECKKALEALGWKNISAYVTHVVFPNESWKNIINCGFKNFYTTNSVPEVTNKLKNILNSPFKILNLFGTNEYKPIEIYVSSHNVQKLQACWNNFVFLLQNHNVVVNGINVDSNIPEQPIGEEQTDLGSQNRLNNMIDFLTSNNINYDYCCSYENGIIIKHAELDEFDDISDVCFLNMFVNSKKNIHKSNSSFISVKILKKFYVLCLQYDQKKTIGQIIQDELGIPKNSFHENFSDGRRTRVDIMEHLIQPEFL